MSAQVPIDAQCTERRARPLLNKGSTFLKNFLKMKIAALAPAAVQAYCSPKQLFPFHQRPAVVQSLM